MVSRHRLRRMELDLPTLADRYTAPPKQPRNGPPCSVGVLLRELSAEDRGTLLGWMELDSGWFHSSIADALAAEGFSNRSGFRVSEQSIGWHRRGKCAC